MKRRVKNYATLSLTIVGGGIVASNAAERPYNILFAIADDVSYPYMSAYGVTSVNTPAFDEVAGRGVLFNNAYVTSPGSSPSRASLLTGLYTWQIEEAGTHGSYFPTKLRPYTDILEEEGYHVGFTGKGWAPGNWRDCRAENPAGKEYNKILMEVPHKGLQPYNYSENFKAFMADRKGDQPFCFWYGGKEAHMPHTGGSWKKEGMNLENAEVPNYLPDTPQSRGNILDFAVEIEWFDKHLGEILRHLEAIGELENTLIVVTADNGMPFASAKASCYDDGTHVPMAICFGDRIKCDKPIEEIVSTIDLAATFLDAAGVESDIEMQSVSLLPWLVEGKKFPHENRALFARERHGWSRYNGMGYPVRAMRRDNMLYIHNFEPDRWPVGDPQMYSEVDGQQKLISGYKDIGGYGYISYFEDNLDDPHIKALYERASQKRPAEMLYDLSIDRGCLNNLVENPAYEKELKSMRKGLFKTLEKTGDTRLTTPEVWDAYPYFGSRKPEYPEP